jgi:hypothetical protein
MANIALPLEKATWTNFEDISNSVQRIDDDMCVDKVVQALCPK